MKTLNASTQYQDGRGSACITWHADHQLMAFSKHHGVPDDQVPIGLRIHRLFGTNRMHPIDDTRHQASLFVEILTISQVDLNGSNIPDFFEHNAPEHVSIVSHQVEIESIDEVLDWFKEIDVILLSPRLAERGDLSRFTYIE